MGFKVAAIVSFLLFSLTVSAHSWHHSYSRSCPNAEWIIKDTVDKHFQRDRTIPAGLIRLHFHDCFVNGCDGSILLESNLDGSQTERLAIPNKNSVRGFEVIEDAKRRLEAACPGIVSCADIVAIAARDSTVKTGGKYYQVPTGRYDGMVSSMQLANANLPGPNFDASQLINNFRRAGLSTKDMVVLSGGHTIGTSKCRFFAANPLDRVYNFSNTGKADPTISLGYLSQLKSMCPPAGNLDNTVELDRQSEFKFDNSYYRNLLHRNGLLGSDQVLAESPQTRGMVQYFAYNSDQFAAEFGNSMVRMGNIGWKTRSDGEIRKVCSAVNSNKKISYGTKTSSVAS